MQVKVTLLCYIAEILPLRYLEYYHFNVDFSPKNTWTMDNDDEYNAETDSEFSITIATTSICINDSALKKSR